MASKKTRNVAVVGLVSIALFILGIICSVYAAWPWVDNQPYWPVGGGQVIVNALVTINSYTNSYQGVPGRYRAETYHWGKLTNIDRPEEFQFVMKGGSRYDWSGEVSWDNCDPANGLSNRFAYTYNSVGEDESYQYSFYVTNIHNFGNFGHHIRAFTTVKPTDTPFQAHAEILYSERVYF